jgi:hypothetical protein
MVENYQDYSNGTKAVELLDPLHEKFIYLKKGLFITGSGIDVRVSTILHGSKIAIS